MDKENENPSIFHNIKTDNWIEMFASINNLNDLNSSFMYTNVPYWVFPQSIMYLTNCEGKIIDGDFFLFRESYVEDRIIHYKSIFVLKEKC